MVYKMWKQECSGHSLWLEYRTPEHFTLCHWQKTEDVNPLWIVYRTVMALYFSFTAIYIVYPNIYFQEENSDTTRKVLIFLTNWTYLVESTAFILLFCIVVQRALKLQKKNNEPMKKMSIFYKIVWIFYTVSLPCSVTVCIIFWYFVYNPKFYPINIRNIESHILNGVFIIIDFCLAAHPVQFLHFYIPGIYAAIYSAFTMIYQLSGGTGTNGEIPIYSIVDWRQPGPTILSCILAFTLLLLFHFLFSLLHIFKVWLKKKYFKSEAPMEMERP